MALSRPRAHLLARGYTRKYHPSFLKSLALIIGDFYDLTEKIEWTIPANSLAQYDVHENKGLHGPGIFLGKLSVSLEYFYFNNFPSINLWLDAFDHNISECRMDRYDEFTIGKCKYNYEEITKHNEEGWRYAFGLPPNSPILIEHNKFIKPLHVIATFKITKLYDEKKNRISSNLWYKYMTISDYGIDGYKGHENKIEIELLKRKTKELEEVIDKKSSEMKVMEVKINDLYGQLKEMKNEIDGMKKEKLFGKDNKEIRNWLEKYDFERYYNNFIIHGYDKFNVILQMSEEDLKDIGINLKGHRKQLILIINDMNNITK